MNRLLPAMLLIALAIGSASAAPPIIPEAVKTKVMQKVDNGYSPGMVIVMVNADGQTYFTYGKVSHDPLAPEPDASTLYEIASVTKTFTSVLLAQMVEAGDVSLTDTVGSFLPPGVSMPGGGGDAITLEQLANHTSGIPSTPSNLVETITSYDNQFANYSVQNLYDFLNSYTLTRSPGSSYEYSNAGMGLLGHVLALSQNRDYEALLRQRILFPMGMFDTVIELSESFAARTAPGHHGTGVKPPFEMNSLSPGGALKACASDLGAYLEYNLGIINSDLTPALELSHSQSYNLPGSYPYDQGLGWWRWDGGDLIQHGGDSFGSTAFVGFRKSTGTGVAILSNNRAHFPAAITDLGFHCLDTSEPLDDVPDALPISEATLLSAVGDYGLFKIELHNDRPVFRVPSSDLVYGAYSNNQGGLATLDIGLTIDMAFNYDLVSGDVTSMTYEQTSSGQTFTQDYDRIRHGAQLSLEIAEQFAPLELILSGEADRDYELECSTDLNTWQALGTIHIWDDPVEVDTDLGEKFYRVVEP